MDAEDPPPPLTASQEQALVREANRNIPRDLFKVYAVRVFRRRLLL